MSLSPLSVLHRAEGTGQLSSCVSNDSAWRSDRISQCALMRMEEKQETGSAEGCSLLCFLSVGNELRWRTKESTAVPLAMLRTLRRPKILPGCEGEQNDVFMNRVCCAGEGLS